MLVLYGIHLLLCLLLGEALIQDLVLHLLVFLLKVVDGFLELDQLCIFLVQPLFQFFILLHCVHQLKLSVIRLRLEIMDELRWSAIGTIL